MPKNLYSATKQGIEAQTIQVEADVVQGLHAFHIVGLPDKAVGEARERISSALKNNNFKPPRSFNKRVVINLAPADIKKEGGVYDLPMAIGFLSDSEQLSWKTETPQEKTLIVGELSLDGSIKPIKGAILYALHAKNSGFETIVVPQENSKEASLIQGIQVIAPENIKELVDHIEARKPLAPVPHTNPEFDSSPDKDEDFAYIQGQEHAKQALEIAAAGGHNVLFQGPPGSGKTLLARAASSILPEMSVQEAMEVTKIESVCRTLPKDNPLITKRPFRGPHHSSSESAILGGGNTLQPGEITRAHHGVLFMDEFPEFHRNVLESLRQPMEEGNVNVVRAKGTVDYPAKFMLIAAANPCPCGYLGDESRECSCTTSSIVKYQRKLSGPVADRIDLHVHVPRQKYKKISSDKLEESSKEIRERVNKAREVQKDRFKKSGINLNDEMSVRHIKKYCPLDQNLKDKLGKAIEAYRLSGRGYHSVLKTARTIADLQDSKDIQWKHLALALQYAKRETNTI